MDLNINWIIKELKLISKYNLINLIGNKNSIVILLINIDMKLFILKRFKSIFKIIAFL